MKYSANSGRVCFIDTNAYADNGPGSSITPGLQGKNYSLVISSMHFSSLELIIPYHGWETYICLYGCCLIQHGVKVSQHRIFWRARRSNSSPCRIHPHGYTLYVRIKCQCSTYYKYAPNLHPLYNIQIWIKLVIVLNIVIESVGNY